MRRRKQRNHEPIPEATEAVGSAVVDSAIKVHTAVGPGLLERVYQEALGIELDIRGLDVQAEVPLSYTYEGRPIDAAFRLDLLVDGSVIIEVKSIERVLPVHHAQLLTYMKLAGCRLGYVLNFNVAWMRSGIKRFVL